MPSSADRRKNIIVMQTLKSMGCARPGAVAVADGTGAITQSARRTLKPCRQWRRCNCENEALTIAC